MLAIMMSAEESTRVQVLSSPGPACSAPAPAPVWPYDGADKSENGV